MATTVNISTHLATFNYQVKVVNPKRKGNNNITRLRDSKRFSTLDEMKAELHSIVEADISGIGFIMPGHGLKGKLTSLLTDGDLDEMYWQYSNKRDILIWCYAETEQNKGDLIENTSRKRSRSPRPQQPHVKQARQDKCDEKIAAVEGIVSELQSINGHKYSVEQFNAWAHMIHVGKHSSLEEPPDLPYFKGSRKRTVPQENYYQWYY